MPLHLLQWHLHLLHNTIFCVKKIIKNAFCLLFFLSVCVKIKEKEMRRAVSVCNRLSHSTKIIYEEVNHGKKSFNR